MDLIIAEKPSLGRAIASAYQNTVQRAGFIECPAAYITWCFGHMFEYALPDYYTEKKEHSFWREQDLPIIPNTWHLKQKPDGTKQLKLIAQLAKEASRIIHAGDPDREGQLIVDRVIDTLKNATPVKRLWLSATDLVSVKKALSDLQDNATHAPLRRAAEARGKADWLIGMNLTRAYTLKAQRGGTKQLISVGRVQTPTLALVRQREIERANFKPQTYYNLTCTAAGVESPEHKFKATYVNPAKDPDEKQHNPEPLNAVKAELAESLPLTGSIENIEHKKKKTPPPLPPSLADLTESICNKGTKEQPIGAAQVLEAAQSLYERHHAITYPRTDCRFLPEEQHEEARSICEALIHYHTKLSNITPAYEERSKAWNTAKITAHHGIIPTSTTPKANLNHIEQLLYEHVSFSYVAQFLPLQITNQAKVRLTIKSHLFTANASISVIQGWSILFPRKKTDDETLPPLAKGDLLTISAFDIEKGKTKPPAAFTEGALVKSMENIYRMYDDKEHRQNLKDGDGIGTPATRATIIEELKRKKYLSLQGQTLTTTDIARHILEALPNQLKSAILTAEYEAILKDIAAATADDTAFINNQIALLRGLVESANQGTLTIPGAPKIKTRTTPHPQHKCKTCGASLVRRQTRQDKTYFWGCSSYPECTTSYNDCNNAPQYQGSKDKGNG